MKKKKIWFFHHYATPPTMSGMIRPYNFAINMLEKTYTSTIFAASYLHYSDQNLINNNDLYLKNSDTEIPFVFIKTPSYKGNGIKRLLNMISYYNNLLKVFKKFVKLEGKPDLIIASSPHPLAMIAGIRIAKKLGIPCINEIRDFWPEVFFMGGKLKEHGFIGKIIVKGEYWIYKNSNALIFLKEGDYTYITDKKWDIDQGGKIDLEKCYYINNGVDIEKFNLQIENERLNDDHLDTKKFKVIYAGAIRPVNNVSIILDAAKLLKMNKNIQFLIYGVGNQVELLKKRIKDESITNVKMKGYVDKKYIPYVLSKSSVNILNYSQKKYNWSRGNSSNKIFEYMASGKPVISTVKMGYSPIEKYDCGISLEEDTPEALAEAVLKVYNMPKDKYNKISKNAKQGAIEFDYKKLTNKLITVMESQL